MIAEHVIANLDCELAWLELASRDPALADLRVPMADRSLSAEAMRRIAPLTTLLRAFCSEDAVLYTPFDVDPACMVEVKGLPMPRIVKGVDGAPADALEWGAVRDVDAARIAARCNHRRFTFDLAKSFGAHLEPSRWIESPADLDDDLPPRWVVKTPLSAAGRDRVIGEGTATEDQRARVEGLIARQGPALLEPWLERVLDISCAGTVGDDDRLRWHLNCMDEAGRFAGIGVSAEDFNLPPFYEDAARRARSALREAGYRGPFGVDGYLIPADDGAFAANPLCEINARLTFGAVAHTLVERVRSHLDDAPDIIDLWTGRGGPPPYALVPLVVPTQRSDTSAWLQDAMAAEEE